MTKNVGPAVRFSLIYFLIVGGLILFSDQLLFQTIPEGSGLLRWEMLKGVGFVLVTAGLLYFALQREFLQRNRLENRYRKLFEEMPVGVYHTDVNGRFIYANPALVALLGFDSLEDLLEMDCGQFYVHEEDRDRWRALVEKQGSIQGVEIQARRPDGSVLWLRDSGRAVKNKVGRVVGFEGILEDVTEHKRAERSLIESEARYSNLFHNNHAVMLVIDPLDGSIVDANNAASMFYGYSLPDLWGMKISDINILTHEEILKEMELARTEQRTQFHFRHRLKNGEVKEVEVYSGPIVIAGQQYLYSIVHDITIQAQVEEAYRESQRALETLMSNLPGMAYRCKLDPNWTMEFVSQGSLDLVGYPPEAFYGNNPLYFSELIHPDDLQLVWDTTERMVAQGEPYQLEYRIRTADGQEKWVWEQGRAVTEAGQGSVVLEGFINDISDRVFSQKKIEMQVSHLAALLAIDTAINSTPDLQSVAETILDQVFHQVRADAATLLRLNLKTRRLVWAAGRGFRSEKAHSVSLELGKSLAGQVAAGRREIMIYGNGADGASGKDELLSQLPWFREEGFAAYFAFPLIAKEQALGVLEVFYRSPCRPDPDRTGFLRTLAGQAAIAIDNASLYEHLEHRSRELSAAYDATLAGWSKALELRDRETQGHSRRVTDLTLKLASRMGAGEEDLEQVRRGTLLHDIGKMGVPDTILLKTGPLTKEEHLIMQQHPAYAYQMLSAIDFLRPALEIAYCHHEKWDGTGYPRGLKGAEIPRLARMFSIVDVWDALLSERPYRPAWSPAKALRYIESEAGRHFDPVIVRAFVSLIQESQE